MQNIISLLSNAHVDIITLVLGVVTALFTQGAKNLSAIPITTGQTGKIRTLAAVLAFGGTFMAAWANGDLASASFLSYLGVAAQSLVTYFFAHITYNAVIKDPNK